MQLAPECPMPRVLSMDSMIDDQRNGNPLCARLLYRNCPGRNNRAQSCLACRRPNVYQY